MPEFIGSDEFVICISHHGAMPLATLDSDHLCRIVHSSCDCYTPDERQEAWDIFRSRPDFARVMLPVIEAAHRPN
jgi:hypothetical protein